MPVSMQGMPSPRSVPVTAISMPVPVPVQCNGILNVGCHVPWLNASTSALHAKCPVSIPWLADSYNVLCLMTVYHSPHPDQLAGGLGMSPLASAEQSQHQSQPWSISAKLQSVSTPAPAVFHLSTSTSHDPSQPQPHPYQHQSIPRHFNANTSTGHPIIQMWAISIPISMPAPPPIVSMLAIHASIRPSS